MSKSKIVYTCPEHEGFKVSKKLTDEGRWCKKCRKYRPDAVERPPHAPMPKIDLDTIHKKPEQDMPKDIPVEPVAKQLPVNKILALLPIDYRNAELCPKCNPVREKTVCTNRLAVVTDKDLEGMTVEDMIAYLKGQFSVKPEVNEYGQPVRWLAKRQIIAIQNELGIHRPN